ncbi:30S ribosomal protein S2 [Candidatus Woesearchaeota archaeon]|jgi:small subunit ribosomal protein S2|nr:30S ribosomal protein S2 [Candidatus Woesearchaeota archaeon]
MPRKKKSEEEINNSKDKDIKEENKKNLEEAKKESIEKESEINKDKEELRKKLLERAKELQEGKIDQVISEELKEKVKVKKREDMLIPLEEYVKTGIYIGTKAVTPMMRPFVYRRRADGLAIFNTDIIDDKLKEAIEYISQFNPEDIVLVCKRQTGWRTAEMLSRLTGIKVFTKKYPAGILTNPSLPDFFENELTIITDSWVDKNALNDTIKANKKILMICDTNNFSQKADKIIIGNNKSAKSIGLIFYLLTRGYCKNRGIEVEIPDLDWWTKEEDAPKVLNEKDKGDSRYGV